MFGENSFLGKTLILLGHVFISFFMEALKIPGEKILINPAGYLMVLWVEDNLSVLTGRE